MKFLEWFVCSLFTLFPSSYHGNVTSEKVLRAGEELLDETLPLQNGACIYHLQGLKPEMWYEVKISYPASIPAGFSLELKRGTPDVGLNQGRKLLNTEKIIFKADGITSLSEQAGNMSVLVSVEAEGFVAIAGNQEREQEYVMFNIVCDELLVGIPRDAWYVVVLVLLCLVLALVVPSFLPAFLLPKQPLSDYTVRKAS